MKKTIINIAVTMTLTGVVLSGAAPPAYAGSSKPAAISDDNSLSVTTETYIYPGMGAGAATGAVVAGPVGLLVGGIIGAFVGASQNVDHTSETNLILATDTDTDTSETVMIQKSVIPSQDISADTLQLAQLGNISTVVSAAAPADELFDILTTELNLDIYFRSGSTAIESFYFDRLDGIARLMNHMHKLDIQLDGYTDRRGNKKQNIALAKQRIDTVRKQLVAAGIDENRIVSKAFGEMNMVSTAGDLDGYTFDRKVVIRFQQAKADTEVADNVAAAEGSRYDNTDARAVVADVTTDF